MEEYPVAPPGKGPARGAPAAKAATQPATPAVPERRGFLTKFLAVVSGAFLSLFPVAVGIGTFLNPLRARKSHTSPEGDPAGEQGWVRVAALDALPADGTPRRFPVIADRHDAWTRYSDQPVGAVFLRRNDAGGAQPVKACNASCPHAGCFVSFNQDSKQYRCPCHESNFTLEGEIISPSPSPRALDDLNVEVRETAQGQEVWVKFENYYAGLAEKKVKP